MSHEKKTKQITECFTLQRRFTGGLVNLTRRFMGNKTRCKHREPSPVRSYRDTQKYLFSHVGVLIHDEYNNYKSAACQNILYLVLMIFNKDDVDETY